MLPSKYSHGIHKTHAKACPYGMLKIRPQGGLVDSEGGEHVGGDV